jgi:hypothetical protein
MLATLALATSFRQRSQIHFQDWLIDGASLKRWIGDQLNETSNWDVIGLPDYTPVANRMIDVLRRRGEPELASRRAVLYRCPECLDLGCGALAVRVIRDSDDIVWSDFAWETDYETVAPMEDEKYSPLPELRFAAGPYDEVLRRARFVDRPKR